jgi:hypothetical protein
VSKAGAIDRTGNGPNGYLAEIGLRVPLQWGLHQAQQREAAAQVTAAQARRQGLELQIQSDLGAFAADLAGSRKTGDLIRTQLLPLGTGHRQNQNGAVVDLCPRRAAPAQAGGRFLRHLPTPPMDYFRRSNPRERAGGCNSRVKSRCLSAT